MLERADRILDAAGELLLRHGYRKVTVDDIASRAEVGKGTVYLHWRTKNELFEALMLRESIELVEEWCALMRQDPANVRPHRFARMAFLSMCRRPLLRAMLTTDLDLLGKLAHHPMRSHDLLAAERFHLVGEKYALLRTDVPHLAYTMAAAQVGFYVLDGTETADSSLDLESRADALAFTVRETFEPAEQPSPEVLAAAATEFITIFSALIPPYRQWIYD
ncbi:TetR/AcrR family transcriptional regulator [Nonomuraea longispora]|uniref:TetR/AcrR family transcriptional regulator n=1 Tax=Nonomuraea longispora TaxID=1848320 RepID=A0A4R4N6I2_9ACTN|nr:TetR/AcrR family transcriptional regulator [Nonomuraea longispora]TDC04365.1 TetR/AcrR family transcriptional regulator [Nonomuraea longispora]